MNVGDLKLKVARIFSLGINRVFSFDPTWL